MINEIYVDVSFPFENLPPCRRKTYREIVKITFCLKGSSAYFKFLACIKPKGYIIEHFED
jgi:hypothetical protein